MKEIIEEFGISIVLLILAGGALSAMNQIIAIELGGGI